MEPSCSPDPTPRHPWDLRYEEGSRGIRNVSRRRIEDRRASRGQVSGERCVSLNPSYIIHIMASPPPKRTRVRAASPVEYALDGSDEEETYTPYVPLSQRRAELATKFDGLRSTGAKRQKEEDVDDEEEEVHMQGPKSGKTLLMEAQEVKRLRAIEGRCL